MNKIKVKEATIPFAIMTVDGKAYVMPYWLEVPLNTKRSDIEVIKSVKKPSKGDLVVTTSTSGSGLGQYKTTYNPTNKRYNCNCMGFWRSAGNCKHVKELKLTIKNKL